MELSKRLQGVVSLMPPGGIICDVGCDHGYVAITFIKRGIAERVIAMDVNAGPLEQARRNAGIYGVTDKLDFRLSDGLGKVSPGEAEAFLCAGMGGRLMVHIMTEGRAVMDKMKGAVLQPQSELNLVRRHIYEMGWHIVKEDMVFEQDGEEPDEGKYYPMMKVVKGKGNDINNDDISQLVKDKLVKEKFSLQDLYEEYGEWLLKSRNRVLLQFLKFEKELYSDILSKLKQVQTCKGEVRQKEIEQKIRFIDLGLEWFADEM